MYLLKADGAGKWVVVFNFLGQVGGGQIENGRYLFMIILLYFNFTHEQYRTLEYIRGERRRREEGEKKKVMDRCIDGPTPAGA